MRVRAAALSTVTERWGLIIDSSILFFIYLFIFGGGRLRFTERKSKLTNRYVISLRPEPESWLSSRSPPTVHGGKHRERNRGKYIQMFHIVALRALCVCVLSCLL